MSSFSNYLEKAILGATLLGSTYTSPATVWLSLCTTMNSDGDFYTEVTTNVGYDRQPAKMVAPTSGPTWRTLLASDVGFGTATSPWGGVTHVAVFDGGAIGAGNMLYWAPVTSVRSVIAGDVPGFKLGSGAGKFQVSLD